jgi:hypothetical protein
MARIREAEGEDFPVWSDRLEFPHPNTDNHRKLTRMSMSRQTPAQTQDSNFL